MTTVARIPMGPVAPEDPAAHDERGVLPDSAVMYRSGGRSYPMVVRPLCIVCNSNGWRGQIETQVIKGFSYASIARGLPEEAGISQHNIRQHVTRKHMPIEENVKAAIIHDRAIQIGLNPEDAEGALIDYFTGIRLTFQRGMERLAAGEIDPTMDQTIRAAELLFAIEQYGGQNVDATIAQQGIRRVMEIVQRTLPTDLKPVFAQALTSDTILRELMGLRTFIPAGSTSANDDDDKVVDAELVEDPEPQPKPKPKRSRAKSPPSS